jgi:hypothetical protein
MVAGLRKAYTVQGRGPFEEGWADTAGQIVKLGGRVSGPMSEPVLADMVEELARLKKAAERPAPVPNAAIQTLQDENWQLRLRYVRCHSDLREL